MNFDTAATTYIQHLTDIGQKPSTISTARRSLLLLVDHFGHAVDISSVACTEMDAFINDDPVIHVQPDGEPRATASRLQIQRILRSACTHWHGPDYLAKASSPRTPKHRPIATPQDPAPATSTPNVDSEQLDSEQPTVQPACEPADVEPLAQPEPLVQDSPANEPLPTQEPAPATPAPNEYVYCHKTHKRRPVAVCQQRGCLSKPAAARCSHWQTWLAAGLVR